MYVVAVVGCLNKIHYYFFLFVYDWIDESIVLEITADCDSIALRKQVQRRFRLRRKMRKAIAETMGMHCLHL